MSSVRIASLVHLNMECGFCQILWTPKLLTVMKQLRNEQYSVHNVFQEHDRVLLFQMKWNRVLPVEKDCRSITKCFTLTT